MADAEKRTVLLIDDDQSLLMTLGDFLQFEGYDVVTADCGEAGLERLKNMTPDLIILDMNMPGMGGMGFLKEISTADGRTRYPVLVLTARANLAEFFADVDVEGFIAKPCDPMDLLNEVGRIIFLRSGTDKSAEAESGAQSRFKVLIGEDELHVGQRLLEAFAEAGYIVDTVAKGPEVLEKAIVQRPDIVLLKLIFAGMNGDAVARMMHEIPNTRDIPIILYDDSSSNVPESKFTDGSTQVRKLVRGNNTDTLLAATLAVLG